MYPQGKYTDQNGQEKTRWLRCGAIITTQAGKMAIKLDTLPLAPAPVEGGEGGIWLQCFEPNQPAGNMHTAAPPQGGFRQPAPAGAPVPQQGAPVPQPQPPAPAQAGYPAQGGNAFGDDSDIPF
jgi:hypothetical protein